MPILCRNTYALFPKFPFCAVPRRTVCRNIRSCLRWTRRIPRFSAVLRRSEKARLSRSITTAPASPTGNMNIPTLPPPPPGRSFSPSQRKRTFSPPPWRTRFTPPSPRTPAVSVTATQRQTPFPPPLRFCGRAQGRSLSTAAFLKTSLFPV